MERVGVMKSLLFASETLNSAPGTNLNLAKGTGQIAEVVLKESHFGVQLSGPLVVPTAACSPGPCSTKPFADMLLETETGLRQ